MSLMSVRNTRCPAGFAACHILSILPNSSVACLIEVVASAPAFARAIIFAPELYTGGGNADEISAVFERQARNFNDHFAAGCFDDARRSAATRAASSMT